VYIFSHVYLVFSSVCWIILLQPYTAIKHCSVLYFNTDRSHVEYTDKIANPVETVVCFDVHMRTITVNCNAHAW